MRTAVLCVAIAVLATTFDLRAEQRRKPPPAPKTVTFAILVSDLTGLQIPSVLVTVEGPTPRTVRTEGGRIALENMAPGDYLLRFERDGFTPLERQLNARPGPPIEIKVTLKPAPAPPPPPPPPARGPSTAKPGAFDVPAVFEREFIGRGSLKMTPLTCGDESSATLIQLNDPVTDHAHPDSDEFIYVVGGEGAANVAGSAHRLRAGMLLFVPRGTTHRFSQSGRNPLVILSTRAGEGCETAGGQAP